MFIDQISVFMENKKGRLAHLTRTLADNGIDLIALSIADTAEYGIMRAIVSDTAKAQAVLKDAGFMVSTTKVIGVVVPDTPGGLADVLQIFTDGDISIEYLYSFVQSQINHALIMFKVEPCQKAIELLESNGIGLLTQDQLISLQGR